MTQGRDGRREKAKEIKKEKRKQAKQVPKGHAAVNEAREQVEKTRLEKLERDREMNRKQQEAAEQKGIAAQILQLVDMNRIDRGRGESAYQFVDGSKIKKLYVTAPLLEQLSRGQVALVKVRETYELVPTVIADKISQRNESVVLVQNRPGEQEVDEDDPYADYQIPDGLMW